MYIKMNCIFMFLLLEIFCFDFSQSREHYRYKRFIEETTTAEPKISLLNKNNNNTSTNSVQNLSTTVIPKTIKNLNTTTPIYLEETTDSFNNVRYTRLSTTNSHRTTFMTTAAPKIAVESIPTAPQRQFDILSFLGGCLFTFCLTGIGFLGWKLYALYLERSYRTI